MPAKIFWYVWDLDGRGNFHWSIKLEASFYQKFCETKFIEVPSACSQKKD